MLIELVLKEYFDNLRMEARTFTENFVGVPVTIRETRHRLLFQLQANPRSPVNTQRLRDACVEITSRNIRAGKRLMRFEVVEAGGGSEPRLV